ncbi:hypothetical protein CEUSTIGMA_g564.t1 [Chlamydomonas eustigma]|uniref:GPI inositol-deacylase n=1 Tax=Chlamydomonas eustigma TaxID=1157962 RepID=A0A250WQN6_9CHLO|nr:hypothetical protein CEUSTIGMA_g564.t1 [Chlamydomonas eustigma]|eukprot:GAX73111.1 hypothetical protein CEUSTIGMA_g564.t1 [Chlamydomonas eustigma]
MHATTFHNHRSNSRKNSTWCQSKTKEAGTVVRAQKRGVLILPGLGNNKADYHDLSIFLKELGLTVEVAAIARLDWSRNALALTDGNWWKGTLKPRPAVDWYLERVDTAMQALKRSVDGAPVTVLTHSAGGWLGRVYLKDFGITGVDRFVSLGSPHQPPPKGILDQTRGILTYCSDACPGAFHSEISYVTIASNFVRGVNLSSEGTLLAKFAGAGYQQVCGEAEVEGDFIVPVQTAHLEGALNINLNGAFHSPLGAKVSFLGPWYGSEEYLSQRVHLLSRNSIELGSSGLEPKSIEEFVGNL